MNTSSHFKKRILLVTLACMAASQSLSAATQCFSQAGTYGNLTVSESGAGCGNFLNYGGITGIWMGDSGVSESCQFDFSPAVAGNTLEVRMTAHSVVPGIAEEAVFSLNGSFVAIVPSDIDNSYPPGGVGLLVGTGGALDPTVGGVSAEQIPPGDGRGTVRFSGAPASVSSINIQHNMVVGNAAGTIYEICADDEGGVAEPASTATFNVSKDFTDDNTTPVEVRLSCNTGLPLEQSFLLTDGASMAPNFSSVTFVVSSFTDGTMDCTVTETPLDNYSPSYVSQGDSQNDNGTPESPACRFFSVGLGDANSCAITNTPAPGEYVVEVDWVVTDEGAEGPIGEVEVAVTCQSDILTVNDIVVAPSTEYTDFLGDGESVVLGIDTSAGASSCSATQIVAQSGAEPQASAECSNGAVEAAGRTTCTFTNTLFFEGIPSLNSYGKAALIMLMLGIGFLGFRRFV